MGQFAIDEAPPPVDNTRPVTDERFCNDPDELTCAICLNQIPPPDLAMVAGCEHLYCVHCILSWALCKETPSCPQCKHKFEHLFVHRQLDGTITDFPIRESVCLLQRATWFEDQLTASDKAKIMSASYMIPDDPSGAAHDPFYDDYYDNQDDDDELEDFYFSSAAGRARILGNRRFGENGFMQSGRRYARPAAQQPVVPKKKNTPQGKQQQQQTGQSSGAGGSGGGGASSKLKDKDLHTGPPSSKGASAMHVESPSGAGPSSVCVSVSSNLPASSASAAVIAPSNQSAVSTQPRAVLAGAQQPAITIPVCVPISGSSSASGTLPQTGAGAELAPVHIATPGSVDVGGVAQSWKGEGVVCQGGVADPSAAFDSVIWIGSQELHLVESLEMPGGGLHSGGSGSGSVSSYGARTASVSLAGMPQAAGQGPLQGSAVGGTNSVSRQGTGRRAKRNARRFVVGTGGWGDDVEFWGSTAARGGGDDDF